MTFSPLALILIPIGYLFLWPLVDRLLGKDSSPLQTALTALVLSIGLLTLALFWIGLLPGQPLIALAALIVVAFGLGAGLALNREWFAPARWLAYWQAQWRRLWRLEMDGLLLLALLGVVTIMLIHATYYPFIGDDTLSRYAWQAQEIYLAHRIPENVSGYPLLAPLSFVATWFAAGAQNEHLAKLFPIIMSVGVLGTTYLIGQRFMGRELPPVRARHASPVQNPPSNGPDAVNTGMLAAALVALTPMFIRNGTLAYTDIPTTFPLMLSAFYALCWWESGRARDAILAGIIMGIATFTKQSALTWVVSLALIPPLWLLAARREPIPGRWRRALVGLAGMTLPAALIGGPWYLRNGLLDGWGNVLPIAGLYHLLEPGVGPLGLIPPLAAPADYGEPLAWLFTLGWLAGVGLAAWQGWGVLRGRLAALPAELVLAVMALLYWLAWWTRFSFDTRFLLLILPVMALWTARPLAWAITWIGERVHLPRLAWQVGGAVLLMALLIWGARDRLGGVYRAFFYPFDSDIERLRHAKGSMVDIVLYIRENLDPETDRIALMDGRMAYYLPEYDVTVMYPLQLADLEGYDYLVHSSSFYGVYNHRLGWRDSEFFRYAWHRRVFETVYESGGVHVMRVLRTSVPQTPP
jgi:hypothetical protein